jgi:hypothetical protein
MKNFQKYLSVISQNPFDKKARYSTAIILPELDTTEGIYRSLIPSYILNSSEELRVIVLGIRERLGLSPNEPKFTISQQLIKETGHIVLPFVSFPLDPVIESVREVKPEMKFSMYIDSNFYTMPDSYPHAKEYKSGERVKIIESNIKAVDQVITTNKAMKDYLIEKIKERYPGVTFGTMISFQQLYVLLDLMKTNIDVAKDKKHTNILLIADEYHFSDMNFIRGILKDIKTRFKDKVKLHIIGFDGKRGGKNYLSDIEFEYHARVPFFNHFEQIKTINPDMLIIPANVNVFNHTSKNTVKYFEAAFLNIPVIGPKIKPYEDLIETNLNGFLCAKKEDYFMQVESYFKEPAKFSGSLGPAYATMTDFNANSDTSIQILKKIYFPHAK